MIEYRGPALAPWQTEAVEAWQAGDSRGPRRGTLEVFTGGGKTLLAIKAFTEVQPERLAVVVPTQALQDQWVAELLAQTSLTESQVGRIGGGRDDSWAGRRVLVAVLNSAATKLPQRCAGAGARTMLVVDECHRAGAPAFSKVLTTDADARLGLSATPDREELDETGAPVDYDDQVLGQQLGEVVFTFDLRRARSVGWLPEYTIHHHGIALTAGERAEYDQVSRLVDDLADQLRTSGNQPSQARMLMGRGDAVGKAAAGYVGATAKRKDLLYRATERRRVVLQLMTDLGGRRTLLFHERVEQATELHAALVEAGVPAVLENSTLTKVQRRAALDAFADGDASVLVSVKSLVEGLNVPAADVGVSVASSSSVRQRIQSLGRVLRRRFDTAAEAGGEGAAPKRADMHVLYVADTVDEVVYAKQDWSDLTGDAANDYLLWPLGATEPEPADGPPRVPLAGEDAEWARLAGEELPARWLGVVPDADHSVNTRGTVTLPSGDRAVSALGVDSWVAALRGSAGGRFKVTPRHRLVVVFSGGEAWLVGQLPAAFEVADVVVELPPLNPGQQYPGPTDTAGGIYKLRQKGGGVLESSSGANRGQAATMRGDDKRARNALEVVKAWKRTGLPGGKVMVNSLGHAYLPDGPTYLASVPEGFTWPEE